MDTVLRTEQLTKKFGDLTAVSRVNLHVYRGEIYGFLGPNGAGKTTLMAMLLGLLRPTSGSFFFFDQPVIGRQPQLFNRVGVVGEEQHFYEEMTGREYLRFFADLLGVRKREQVIDEWVEYVTLGAWQHKAIRTYSHGTRQKLGLIRALLHDPDLLLLDEPVTGLDVQSIRAVRELLLELRRRGKTIFLTSHILSEVERVADRVGILQKGRLLAEGTISDLGRQVQERMICDIELSEERPMLSTALGQLPFVRSVEATGRKLAVEMDADGDYRASLSQAITAQGGVIVAMGSRTLSLEETFVTLTESNLQEVAELVNRRPVE